MKKYSHSKTFRQWYDSDSRAAQLTQKLYRAGYHLLKNPNFWFLDLAGDNVIFLAGSGRSGTTWVQELINHQHDHRIIHEPFHTDYMNLPWDDFRLYLPTTSSAPELEKVIARILQGRLRSVWADKRNRAGIYRKRLIKSIRANLFLKWLQHHFPSLKIVFLMRHPCAVVSSQIRDKYFRYQKRELMNMLAQDELLRDYLSPFAGQIHEAQSEFEIYMFIWAIENYLPLQQFSSHELFLLFYENLYQEPEREIARLFEFLELPLKPTILEAVHRPSSTTRKHSAILKGKSVIDSWRNHLTPLEIKQGIRILSHFGLDRIYSEASMPCVEAAYQMLEY